MHDHSSMLDQLFAYILLGLGISSPLSPGAVKGDQTETSRTESTKSAEARDKMESLRDVKDVYRVELKERHEAIREALAKRHDEFSQEFEIKRASAAAQREEKVAKLEEKLEAFKDTKKKEKVSDIQERLSSLNDTLTIKAAKTLTKISEVLNSVIEKAAQEKANDKDTAALDAALEKAQSAVVSAQNAIASQAAKPYVVTLTSEVNAKRDVESSMKLLREDIKVMQTAIVEARKAVSVAIRELAILRGETPPQEIIR